MQCRWPPTPVIPPLSPTEAAKPKTPSLPIWWWRREPAKSKPVLPAAPIASRSTTNCCGSRKTWVLARATPARRRLLNEARPVTGRPLVLSILDGWGFSPLAEGNAIAAATKPNYDRLVAEYPNTLVYTSGPYVGLPEGQMGNSEVGHLNIGAGRIIYMDVTRLDRMIASGDFYRHPVLLESMHHARSRRLHLMGLLSDGGVHSMNTHLYALLEMAKREGVADVAIHCFMDGRDTPPQSGAGYLEELQREIRRIGVGRIATVSGR